MTLTKLSQFQDAVDKLYAKRGFTGDLPTLGLGLCEEAGEVAKAINVDFNSKYIPSDHCEHGLLVHELCDALVYLLGIANSAGYDIQVEFEYYLKGKIT